MSLHIPEKLLVGKIRFGTTTISEYYSGGAYDGAPLSYQATFDIPSYSAGYPGYYNNPNLYNVNDIEIGWQFLLPNGKWYDIINIASIISDTEVVLEFRDTDLKILTTDPSNDPPSNAPVEGNYGILYPVVDGLAKIANLSNFTAAFPVDSYWIDDIQSAVSNKLALGGFGSSGSAGSSGTSGTSGIDGTSGTSGIDGTSGTSGVDGVSGTSGSSGSSGTSGDSIFISGSGFWYTQNNIQITGSLDVKGPITAEQLNIAYVSSSVIYQSGSTKFGDTSDDVHAFTGSINTTGSVTINGDLFVNGTSVLKAVDPNRDSLIVSGAVNIVKNEISAAQYSASLAFENTVLILQQMNNTIVDLGGF